MELREALRHDLDLDGLLKGKSKKEIEDLIKYLFYKRHVVICNYVFKNNFDNKIIVRC